MSITKSAFHHLRNIAKIRPYLTLPDAERLIHAFVCKLLKVPLYFSVNMNMRLNVQMS